MSEAFTFSVRGTPRPKARPRFVNGRVVTTASPKEKLWRAGVERAARQAVKMRGDPAPLFRGPVRVRMVFTFQIPATGAPTWAGQPHTRKPDADNIAKLCADAMERAGVFKNDSQIADMPVEKRWGEVPGVAVMVEPIEREAAPLTRPEGEAPGWLGSTG